MHDRYPPPGPDQRWPGASPSRREIPPAIDPTLRFDEPASDSRGQGLRRLSRLTWRTTQLSAITAAAFAVLFARSAPAQTASSQAPVKPASTLSPSASPSPTATHRAAAKKHQAHRAAATPQPTAAATQPASAPPPSPTLAPPSTPPAPAPTPSAVQTTSSGSTGGG